MPCRISIQGCVCTHEEQEGRQTSGIDGNLEGTTPAKDVAHDEDYSSR